MTMISDSQMSSVRISIGLLISVILLNGCRDFLTFEIENTPKGAVISSDQFIEKCGKNEFYIYDLAVAKKQCDSDCIQWSVVRSKEPESNTAYQKFPITYGESFTDVETRQPARALSAGVYEVSGTLACADNPDFSGASLVGSFEVLANE